MGPIYVCACWDTHLHTCGSIYELSFDTFMLACFMYTYAVCWHVCVTQCCSENVHWYRLCVLVYTDPQQLLYTTCDQALPQVCCGSKQSLWAHRNSGFGCQTEPSQTGRIALLCLSYKLFILIFFLPMFSSLLSSVAHLFLLQLADRCQSAPRFTTTPTQLQASQLYTKA